MSGPVKSVASTVKTVGWDLNPFVNTAKAGITAASDIVKGDNIGQAIGEGVKSGTANYVDFAKNIGQGLGIVGGPVQQAQITSAADTEAAQAKATAAAARQAQVDLIKQNPGRGSSILTDNYNYNV